MYFTLLFSQECRSPQTHLSVLHGLPTTVSSHARWRLDLFKRTTHLYASCVQRHYGADDEHLLKSSVEGIDSVFPRNSNDARGGEHVGRPPTWRNIKLSKMCHRYLDIHDGLCVCQPCCVGRVNALLYGSSFIEFERFRRVLRRIIFTSHSTQHAVVLQRLPTDRGGLFSDKIGFSSEKISKPSVP
jgi:hypothetical protein